MSLEDQIRELLFEMTKEIKFHKVTNDNVVMEVDYEKYVLKLKSILGGYTGAP